MQCTLWCITSGISHFWQTAVSIAVIHLPCLSESPQWYLRAMKIKAHRQIANTIKQFTSSGSGVSRVFDVLAYKPLWPLVDTPPKPAPRFRTWSSTVCAPARKSMCVTNPTMKRPQLSWPSCLFHSCLTDEEAAEQRSPALWSLYLCRRSVSLWCLSVNWLAFSGFDPGVWCKTQTPTHQREQGGVGEWISILEEILTLGTKAMRHPAFF